MLHKGKKKVGKDKTTLLGFKGLCRTKDDTKVSEKFRRVLIGCISVWFPNNNWLPANQKVTLRGFRVFLKKEGKKELETLTQ